MSATIVAVAALVLLVAAHHGRRGLSDIRHEPLMQRVRFEVADVDDVEIGDEVSGLGTVTAISRTGYQQGFVRLEAGSAQSVLATGSAVLVRAHDGAGGLRSAS